MSAVTAVTTVTGKLDIPPLRVTQCIQEVTLTYVYNPGGGHVEKSGYSGYHGYRLTSCGRGGVA